jgi:3-dehydroquinate dehydratase-2
LIKTIHIVNGPNLNLLGKREVEIYGSKTFETYFEELKKNFPQTTLHYYQSNHEGHLMDYLHQFGFDQESGIILNAGGLTHTSICLRDAIAAIECPTIEVHISNIYKRESFRWKSYLTDVCVAHFIGHGLDGYRMGIDYLLSGK